jgi:hypothetical protein
MKQISPTDHRIFGFTELGQIRASLFNGAGVPDAGTLYSWVWASTLRQLAHKLAEQWEQPITEAELAVIELLEEAETEAERTIDCSGTGRDHGSLNPFEPEDCPSCAGSGRETPKQPRRPAGRQTVNTARQGVA